MDDLLSPEYLRKVIMSEDDLYTFEYCTLDKSSYKVMSVIPVEWKGSILSKVMLIAQDIGQKHELEKLANTDALTGLYNERYLSERLKRNGKLHKNLPCSIWIWTGLSLLMTLMDMTWGQIAEGGFLEIVQMYQEDRLCFPYRWR